MKTIYSLLVLTVFGLCEGREVPSSFQKCKRTDENLTQCLTQIVNKGWSELFKGEPTYDWGTIQMQPVDEEVVNIFHTKLTNGSISGLKETKFNEIKVDFKDKIFTIIFTIPKLVISGNTDFQANLFGLKLTEAAPVIATYYDGVYNFRFQYDLWKNGGEEYLKIIKNELDYTIDKLNIEFKTSDRSILGRQNKLFNDNWKTVNAVSSRTASKVLAKTFAFQVEKFLEDIPFNRLFE